MTAPVCSCGTVHLNGCPGRLDICLNPGFVFDGTVRLLSRLTRLPVDWPTGTAARIRFSWGTGTSLIFPATVDGSYLRFHLTAAETEQVPSGSLATIDVNYDSGDPDLWRPWKEGRISACG